MASSFIEQACVIVPLLEELRPKAVLDVGKGLGKYGFLIHEYLGIGETTTPDPARKLKDQSSVRLDAVEIQPNYMLPHIGDLYETVHMGDITEIYPTLTGYDAVLMADVIEHIERTKAIEVVTHFIEDGSTVVVSTPHRFWTQDNLYGSPWETHRSFWTPKDFQFAPYMDWQTAGRGNVYLLARERRQTGLHFGSRPRRRMRRFLGQMRDVLRDSLPPEPTASGQQTGVREFLYER